MKSKKAKKPNRLLWFAGTEYTKRFAKQINLKVFDGVSDKLKPPYIVLCNHGSVQDYKISCQVLRKLRPVHVTAHNQFFGREKIMRMCGAVPTRQFSADISLVKNIKSILDQKGVFVIYPEAAVSIDGANRKIHSNIAKLIKMFKLPVTVINIKGAFISKPRWNEVQQKTDRTEAHFEVLFNKKEVESKSADEIYEGIVAGLNHNVWDWQKESGVRILSDGFLEKAENLLYQCPNCLTEFKMRGSGNVIRCEACGSKWRMSELGEFEIEVKSEGRSLVGEVSNEYPKNVFEWMEFQRAQIKERLKKGEYNFSVGVRLEVSEGFAKYKPTGEGVLSQTNEGLRYRGVKVKRYERVSETSDNAEHLHLRANEVHTSGASKKEKVKSEDKSLVSEEKNNGEKIELFFSADKTADCLMSKYNAEIPAEDCNYRFVMKEVNASAKICLGVYECWNSANRKEE